MSSGVWHEKCPQCGGVYVKHEEYGQFLETHGQCMQCGRTNEECVKKDQSGQLVFDSKGNVVWDISLNEGYGCVAISNDCVTTVYSLTKPVDEEIKKVYLKNLDVEGVIKEECYLTSWNDEKKEVVAVFGKLPETYDETIV